jgi:hypothetical protein
MVKLRSKKVINNDQINKKEKIFPNQQKIILRLFIYGERL